MRPAVTPPPLAKMAPASATLRLCPTTPAVASTPEDSPCLSVGAAFIRARVFGGWKSPWPSPVIARRQMISPCELCASSPADNRRPRQAIATSPGDHSAALG